MKKMFNEGNQIHNFMSSSGSGTVINYGSGSGSDFLTSYGSGYGSGSTSQKVTVPTVPVPVPVPVPQHCLLLHRGSESGSISQRLGSADPDPDPCQHVMDLQHWQLLPCCSIILTQLHIPSFYIVDPNPDPLVRVLDPRIRFRIHAKMSWIRNSGFCNSFPVAALS